MSLLPFRVVNLSSKVFTCYVILIPVEEVKVGIMHDPCKSKKKKKKRKNDPNRPAATPTSSAPPTVLKTAHAWNLWHKHHPPPRIPTAVFPTNHHSSSPVLFSTISSS